MSRRSRPSSPWVPPGFVSLGFADADAEPGQAVERVDVRGRHADDGADLTDRAGERVQLERPAGLDVLQHRGAEVAELAGDRVPVVRGLRDRAADPRADFARLEHGR